MNDLSREALAAERHASLSRRRFLRGAGVCLALPAFETFLHAAASPPARRLGATATGAPLRMAYIYFPNGAHQGHWWPKGEGKEFRFNQTLEPLESLKHRVQVLGGLNHQGGYPGPDGPGDHARASGGFLTGVRVKKTAGADIRANISIDQVVAGQVGHLTRFPSLELSCDAVRRSGSCDSGYSCAYQYNLAWRSPSTPLPPEPNPRLVFERLFGGGPKGKRSESYRQRQEEQRSVLDFVLDDARELQRQLGGGDRRKLDEYLSGLREIEQRINKAERFGKTADPDAETPAGIPASFPEYLGLMFDLMLLAFQTDSTRICTFLMANDGSNRPFTEIDIIEGHHYLTHHRGRTDMMEKVAKIDRFYVQQFARFLEKLERTKDTDGNSLLYNSMIVYGGGIADGNRHTHSNLPIVLAGAGGGSLSPGRYTRLRSMPVSNLFLSLLDRFGGKRLERFGDSTGRAEGV